MIKKTTELAKTHWLKILLPVVGCVIGSVMNDGLSTEDSTTKTVTDAVMMPLITDRKLDRLVSETDKSFETAFQRDSILMVLIKDVKVELTEQRKQNAEMLRSQDILTGKLDGLIEGIKFRNTIGMAVGFESRKDTTKPCNISMYEE